MNSDSKPRGDVADFSAGRARTEEEQKSIDNALRAFVFELSNTKAHLGALSEEELLMMATYDNDKALRFEEIAEGGDQHPEQSGLTAAELVYYARLKQIEIIWQNELFRLETFRLDAERQVANLDISAKSLKDKASEIKRDLSSVNFSDSAYDSKAVALKEVTALYDKITNHERTK